MTTIAHLLAPITLATSSPASPTALHMDAREVDSPSLTNRIYYFAKAKLRDLQYRVITGGLIAKHWIFGYPIEYISPSGEYNRWKTDSKGLVVAIHGLLGLQNIWKNHLAILQKEHPEVDVRVPYVPKKGNCSLNQAVQPIEAMVRSYIQKHPGKPVCLMGVSNGGRIAAELEVRLRDTKAPIKVSCVAGVLSGTKRLDDLYWITQFLYQPDVIEELRYRSQTVQNLLKRMRAPLPWGVERSYDFYATSNDEQIVPFTGSFPHLPNKDATYHVVHGESHSSIVSKVAVDQMNSSTDWMGRVTGRKASFLPHLPSFYFKVLRRLFKITMFSR